MKKNYDYLELSFCDSVGFLNADYSNEIYIHAKSDVYNIFWSFNGEAYHLEVFFNGSWISSFIDACDSILYVHSHNKHEHLFDKPMYNINVDSKTFLNPSEKYYKALSVDSNQFTLDYICKLISEFKDININYKGVLYSIFPIDCCEFTYPNHIVYRVYYFFNDMFNDLDYDHVCDFYDAFDCAWFVFYKLKKLCDY